MNKNCERNSQLISSH